MLTTTVKDLPLRSRALVAFCVGGVTLIAAVSGLRPMATSYTGFQGGAGADRRQVRQFTDAGRVLLPANGWRPLIVSFEARAQNTRAAVPVTVSADGTVLTQISATPEWRHHEILVKTPVVFPRHVEIDLSAPGQTVAIQRALVRYQLLAWHTAKLFLLGGIAGIAVWLAARRVQWGSWLRTALFCASIAVYLLLVTRVAWVGDDAYITFRTVENVLAGYGARWNAAERVQTFTHPLWFGLLIPARMLAGEPYIAALTLSFAAALSAFCLVLRMSASTSAAMLAGILLVLSRSFVDYSTSGLENPLLFLLLGLFYWRHWTTGGALDAVTCLLAALVFLTRADAILLILPALVLSVWRAGARMPNVRTVAAFAPAVAWVVFSFWYYGFPVPNTAPAKLNAGVPSGEMWSRGVAYLAASARWDPILIPAAVLAGGGALFSRSTTGVGAVAGLVMYCVYVVRIGGDFMVGRFLAAPLFVSVLLIARTCTLNAVPPWLRATIIAGATAGWCAIHPEILERLRRGSVVAGFLDREAGIVDERWNYYAALGLLSRRASNHPAFAAGIAARESGQRVALRSAIGIFGFAAGPSVHVLDTVALGDPLLARLPANPPWTPGHFERRVPDGYVETLEGGVNRLRDPRLARFYDDLSLVTRGPLWSLRRIRTAAALNVGRHRADLPREIVAVESPLHDGTVTGRFAISGWAVDLSASTGTGVDAVHIYAYPRGASGAPGAPIALGFDSYGQPRPDVAGDYGAQFTKAGYALQVEAGRLAPGNYFIVVYARNAATHLFNARRIRVTIE